MLHFECDYLEGCHENIMHALIESNTEQTSGYGEDEFCARAKKLILDECKKDGAVVHFLVGGTQTNMTVIASLLKPYQGVLSAESGHINVHETGAIESTGHKVLALPGNHGKISASQVRAAMEGHKMDAAHEHIVQPGMVYISNPTECGTIYNRKELQELRSVCKEYDLPLFMDGARLGYALTAKDNDLTLEEIAACCDVFYIGGTKTGALFGEAVVITDKKYQKDFRYYIKQKGGMLAKGRLLGIQFETLFTDGLYLKIAGEAINKAELIKKILEEKGCQFLYPPQSNQLFPFIPDRWLQILQKNFVFEPWGVKKDDTTAVRICTSALTSQKNFDALCTALNELQQVL